MIAGSCGTRRIRPDRADRRPRRPDPHNRHYAVV